MRILNIRQSYSVWLGFPSIYLRAKYMHIFIQDLIWLQSAKEPREGKSFLLEVDWIIGATREKKEVLEVFLLEVFTEARTRIATTCNSSRRLDIMEAQFTAPPKPSFIIVLGCWRGFRGLLIEHP